MKISLNTQILLGAGCGIALGLFLSAVGSGSQLYGSSIYFCDILGRIFVDLLKMILIPLVFVSITVGIANLRRHAQMDRVWKITFIFFLSTTALAILESLFVLNIFKPGVGLNIDLFKDKMSSFQSQDVTLGQFIQSFLSGIFMNPFSAMASGNVLATVVFAFFLGIALVVAKDASKYILNVFNELFDIIMLIVGWIMRVAPFGIMALMAKLIATQNPSLFVSLGKFIAVVVGVTIFHGFIVLPGILYAVTRYPYFKFYNGVREALITAFSTSSSNATLPVSMRCTENNLKVDKDIAGFVLPLGATINMDGTAIYEAAAALFVANLVGIHLNIVQQLIVFFTAMLASIGAPGIPSAGMVTMIMVLQSVGLPVEAIAILLPIDRPLDALRTVVNVEGDMVGSLIVQKLVSKK